MALWLTILAVLCWLGITVTLGELFGDAARLGAGSYDEEAEA